MAWAGGSIYKQNPDLYPYVFLSIASTSSKYSHPCYKQFCSVFSLLIFCQFATLNSDSTSGTRCLYLLFFWKDNNQSTIRDTILNTIYAGMDGINSSTCSFTHSHDLGFLTKFRPTDRNYPVWCCIFALLKIDIIMIDDNSSKQAKSLTLKHY